MEMRDQVTQDHLRRPWHTYSEVEQGALLVELAASLKRRLMHTELDESLTRAYLAFAHAARNAGHALVHKYGVPFVPSPPFQWSRVPLDEVNEWLPAMNAWATEAITQEQQTMAVRHTCLDLREASRGLEHQLDRSRGR